MRNDPELQRACAIVAAKDTQPLRRALFEQLSAQRRSLRWVRRVWAQMGTDRRAAGFVSPLAVGCFFAVRFPERDGDLVAVCAYRNEERQVEALRAIDPDLRIETITLAPGAPSELPRLDALAGAWELVRTYARGGDFLVAARVACTVGYYARMLPLLERSTFPAVLVSSDTNPYAVALVHAARRVGRKTCFVTHGHVAEGPPRLDFDLSLLDGPAVRDVYARSGAVGGAVVFKGCEGTAEPMDTSRLRGGVETLGVFLSIEVDWRRVGVELERLRERLRPRHIVLRLHPNRTLRDPRWRSYVRLDGVQVSEGDRVLTGDASACDLVVAGNTSAHLTVLKLGVPAVYVSNLDETGDDYYGFVRERVVPPAGSLDLGTIAAFYDDPGWVDRFARFDAAYPDRKAACDRAVRDALRALVRLW